MQNRSNLNIELIRCLAIFCVILIHMSMVPFHNKDLFLTASWFTQNFYFAISRFCVPVFFIISAYFFFKKPSLDLGNITKRLFKIIPPLFFWSIAYYTYYVCAYTNYDFSVDKFFHGFLYSNSAFHLWFLYKFIGFCIFLPIAYACYVTLPKGTYIFLFLILLIPSSLIPALTAISSSFIQYEPLKIIENFAILRLPDSNFIYAFCAPFLISAIDNKKIKISHLTISYTAILIANFTLTYFISHREGSTNEFFYNYFTPLVILSSCCLFVTIAKLNIDSMHPFAKKIISEIGNATLGIYLIHWLIFMLAEKYLLNNNETPYINCIINTIIVFIISFTIVFIARRIRFIKSIV